MRKQSEKKYQDRLNFKIDTNAFLNEIVENALMPNMGVLKAPLNIFKNFLAQIADRCSEINDPVPNKIMCDMALYEQASPTSKDYDKNMIEQVYKNYEEYLLQKQQLKK